MRFHTAVIAAILLTACPVFAQRGAAELRGTVVDQQDAVLGAVVLRVRNQETGVYRVTRSNPDGTYFVSGLPPGRYELRASLPGFKQSLQPGIRLEVGRTTTVNITLVVGPVADSVNLEAVTPLLDTTSKTVGGRIGSEDLLGLPSANRSFVGFVALLPGIVPIPADALGANAVGVNGIDPRSNNFLLDGANNNDDYLGQRAGTQARTPIEAIQEFQVLTHQFDAEFGRATGAVVNAVTRQGSNHTWGVRWLRESSPQENVLIPAGGRQVSLDAAREEHDVDQTTVGSLQSVFGNSRLNTLRVAFTRENVAFANPGFNSNGRRQDLLLPTLQYQTFIDQQNDVATARIDNAWSIEDTVSWFVPARGGSHDLKFGFQYQYATVESTNQNTLNGLFEFRTNPRFDTADPATYPERLQIRVPGPADLSMKAHFISAFLQERWRVGDRLTVSLGVRYDFESIPLREEDNPAFPDPAVDPIDANNFGPRLGSTYGLDSGKRSVLRGGYGIFYDKTSLELLAPIVTSGRFSSSFIAFFPANGIDPGPSQGRLPVEPMLRNGQAVDWDVIRQIFPPGVRIRDMGTVFFDSPARRVPRADQISLPSC